jgi:predicted ABC-type ATPase
VYLNSVSLAKERVSIRITKGGHSIPLDVIERRYFKGLQNLGKYLSETDAWYIYDNSGNEYEVVAKGIANEENIFNFELFSKITGK